MKLVNLNPARCCLAAWVRLRASPLEAFDHFWDFTRRYFFALTLMAMFGAKLLHLYAHIHSLPPSKFLLWGVTFFCQDVVLVLLVRILTQKLPWRSVAAIFAVIVVPFR